MNCTYLFLFFNNDILSSPFALKSIKMIESSFSRSFSSKFLVLNNGVFQKCCFSRFLSSAITFENNIMNTTINNVLFVENCFFEKMTNRAIVCLIEGQFVVKRCYFWDIISGGNGGVILHQGDNIEVSKCCFFRCSGGLSPTSSTVTNGATVYSSTVDAIVDMVSQYKCFYDSTRSCFSMRIGASSCVFESINTSYSKSPFYSNHPESINCGPSKYMYMQFSYCDCFSSFHPISQTFTISYTNYIGNSATYHMANYQSIITLSNCIYSNNQFANFYLYNIPTISLCYSNVIYLSGFSALGSKTLNILTFNVDPDCLMPEKTSFFEDYKRITLKFVTYVSLLLIN